jgi:hypothetical protein
MATVTDQRLSRREHQRTVAALLEELDDRRRHIHVLQAGGATLAGLRDLKAELSAVRGVLAAAVEA